MAEKDAWHEWIVKQHQEMEREQIRAFAERGSRREVPEVVPEPGGNGDYIHQDSPFLKSGCFIVVVIFLVLATNWQEFGAWLWSHQGLFWGVMIAGFIVGGLSQRVLYPPLRFIATWGVRLVVASFIAMVIYMFVRSNGWM